MARVKKMTAVEALAARIRELELESQMHRALSWPTEHPNQLDPRKAHEDACASARELGQSETGVLVTAWTYTTAHQGLVTHGCFSATSHCRHNTLVTSTQSQGGPWFRSELEAWQALRERMTREVAVCLMRIDRKIEDARTS